MISLFFGLSKVMRGHRSMMQDNREPLIVLPDQPPDVFGSLRLLYWLRRMGSPMRKYDNKLYRVAGTPRILPCQRHGFGAWPQHPRASLREDSGGVLSAAAK